MSCFVRILCVAPSACIDCIQQTVSYDLGGVHTQRRGYSVSKRTDCRLHKSTGSDDYVVGACADDVVVGREAAGTFVKGESQFVAHRIPPSLRMDSVEVVADCILYTVCARTRCNA